jgi:hypothetical protein
MELEKAMKTYQGKVRPYLEEKNKITDLFGEPYIVFSKQFSDRGQPGETIATSEECFVDLFYEPLSEGKITPEELLEYCVKNLSRRWFDTIKKLFDNPDYKEWIDNHH